MGGSIFEAIMIICFGLAWPIDIYKTLKAKTSRGKSLMFMGVLLIGYASGIINKVLYSRDIVMALYILNFALVTVDMILVWRFRKLDEERDKESMLPNE